jgi:hypothetical protein
MKIQNCVPLGNHRAAEAGHVSLYGLFSVLTCRELLSISRKCAIAALVHGNALAIGPIYQTSIRLCLNTMVIDIDWIDASL